MNKDYMKEFKDIYEMIHVPWWQRFEIKLVLLIVALCILVCIIFWMFKTFKRKQTPTDPTQEALFALRELQSSSLLSEHNVNFFYVRLTYIIKTYLGARYQYDFASCTDPEMLSYLGDNINFPPVLLPLVHDLVMRSQEIKFAQGGAIIDQMNKDLDAAAHLIHKTLIEKQK